MHYRKKIFLPIYVLFFGAFLALYPRTDEPGDGGRQIVRFTSRSPFFLGLSPVMYRSSIALSAVNNHDQEQLTTALNLGSWASGDTMPLFYAAISNNNIAAVVSVITYLQEHGVSLTCTSLNELLAQADAMGRKRMVALFLAQGAAGFTLEKWRAAPLHTAARYNFFEKALQLLATTDSDGRDSFERTPLHYACQNGHARMAQLLLNNHASIDAVAGACEYTPLHLAAREGHESVVRLLLARGASPVAESRGGQKTAADLARENGHSTVATLIEQAIRYGEQE